MTAAALRKELQGYIAKMPERNLSMLEPLLSRLAKPDYTIEPANPEESAMVEERVKEYHENPDSFIPWAEARLT
ncbi:MAG: addiction module protein [Spirochaetaceae bacterium]|jgi:hypothetical protein|nr:addiction module protein [Spirochaetaceae bacterium]